LTRPQEPKNGSPTDLDRVLRFQRRENRDRSGVFLIEGTRLLATACDHGFKFETLIVCRKLLKQPIGQILARRLRQRGVPTLRVSVAEFERLTICAEPSGVAAIVRQRWQSVERLTPRPVSAWLAVETVRSPGNLGTLLRTSEAAGFDGLFALGKSVDLHDPRVVRASMGALLSRTLVRCHPDELRRWKRRHGAHVFAATPDGDLDYRDATFGGTVVVLLGDERKGLSRRQLEICDERVRIPMTGDTDSLNLAVAGSLLAYEVFDRRRRKRPRDPVNDVREKPRRTAPRR
jgi:TrmH family RNA methyltransferase